MEYIFTLMMLLSLSIIRQKVLVSRSSSIVVVSQKIVAWPRTGQALILGIVPWNTVEIVSTIVTSQVVQTSLSHQLLLLLLVMTKTQ